jgi:hypothetical protein
MVISSLSKSHCPADGFGREAERVRRDRANSRGDQTRSTRQARPPSVACSRALVCGPLSRSGLTGRRAVDGGDDLLEVAFNHGRRLGPRPLGEGRAES